ncbi:hypothetical protein H310_08083 [Aphanomyces invadans]|uniref:DUF7769 domain-containing protein n=1 Tax=Aphanomyces invadans TaxID=157072 RepID=A0A024TYZ6_9STRA|nr:hypothetical protein H310_08083 [Aphanomyces invadans]ETV99370.1 hypothetical protein H310_08083 [Aphanomyces invadans]|eukprot:XP_008871926.1 hypothetical protein H310_08083 [Aphanomyces invadans]
MDIDCKMIHQYFIPQFIGNTARPAHTYRPYMPHRSPRGSADAPVAVRDLAELRKHLSFAHRRTTYETLLSVAVDGVLPRGALTELAQKFRCHPRTITRLWTQARLSVRDGYRAADVATRTKGNSGRHALRTSDEIEAAIGNVPQMQLQALPSLSAACGIPMTTIFRHMKKNSRFKAVSNHVKPHLTLANVEERLKFAMSFVRSLQSKVDAIFSTTCTTMCLLTKSGST